MIFISINCETWLAKRCRIVEGNADIPVTTHLDVALAFLADRYIAALHSRFCSRPVKYLGSLISMDSFIPTALSLHPPMVVLPPVYISLSVYLNE